MRPNITADTIIPDKRGNILLIKRGKPPFEGFWAIPGGFLDVGKESLQQAAIREAQEETNLHVKPLTLLGVYSHPLRDIRGHTITAAYIMQPVSREQSSKTTAGDDAAGYTWISPHEALKQKLAFDHKQIIADYIHWMQQGGTYWSEREGRKPIIAKDPNTTYPITPGPPPQAGYKRAALAIKIIYISPDERLLVNKDGKNCFLPMNHPVIGQESVEHSAEHLARQLLGLHDHPEAIVSIYTAREHVTITFRMPRKHADVQTKGYALIPIKHIKKYTWDKEDIRTLSDYNIWLRGVRAKPHRHVYQATSMNESLSTYKQHALEFWARLKTEYDNQKNTELLHHLSSRSNLGITARDRSGKIIRLPAPRTIEKLRNLITTLTQLRADMDNAGSMAQQVAKNIMQTLEGIINASEGTKFARTARSFKAQTITFLEALTKQPVLA